MAAGRSTPGVETKISSPRPHLINVGGKQSPEPIIAEPIHTTADPIGPRRRETALHSALVWPSLILDLAFWTTCRAQDLTFPCSTYKAKTLAVVFGH
jgi:hypothetical protein